MAHIDTVTQDPESDALSLARTFVDHPIASKEFVPRQARRHISSLKHFAIHYTILADLPDHNVP